MNYTLKPKFVALFLGSIATYLALQSLIGEYLIEKVLPAESDALVVVFIDLWSVNLEESFPTWFSTMLLFFSALLLFFIWGIKRSKEDPWTRYWFGLSAVFLYLSLDEGVGIHETFVDPLGEMFNTSGYLAFSWQILFLPLAIIFALIYIPFLRNLPPQTMRLFIISGLIYVGGAIFVEGISANRWYLDGGVSFRYLAIATVEEFCEMMGAVLFIYTLLDYIVEGRYSAAIRFLPDPPAPIEFNLGLLGQRAVKIALVCIVMLNFSFTLWVLSERPIYAVSETTLPYYARLTERYPEYEIILLQYNQVIDPARAAGLIGLFDDVLVVSDPLEETSIIFASQSLPFSEAELMAELALDEAYAASILNQADLVQIAQR